MKHMLTRYRKDARVVLAKVDDILVEELINSYAVRASELIDGEIDKLEDILFKYSNEMNKSIKSDTVSDLLEYTLVNIIGINKAKKDNHELLEYVNTRNRQNESTVEQRLLVMFSEHKGVMLNRVLEEMKVTLGPYMKVRDNQLFKLELKKTSSIVTNKILTLADIIILEKLGECVEVLGEVAKQIELQEKDKKGDNTTTQVLDVQIQSIKNMFDYKALNKLAANNGYVLRNQTGSHGQYKHINGNLITIPQGRTIGKGLSCKIQKNILGGSLNVYKK